MEGNVSVNFKTLRMLRQEDRPRMKRFLEGASRANLSCFKMLSIAILSTNILEFEDLDLKSHELYLTLSIVCISFSFFFVFKLFKDPFSP